MSTTTTTRPAAPAAGSAGADPWAPARAERLRQAEDLLLTMPLATVGGHVGSARVQVAHPKLTRLGRGALGRRGHGVFRVPTVEAGDERYTWDAGNFAEINEAKRFFDEMVEKGMVPFPVGPDGLKSTEPMRVFDPLAEEIVFVPINVPRAVVGG